MTIYIKNNEKKTMPNIDKIILSFFVLSIPLAIALKSFNLYLNEKTKKDSVDILYSEFKENYFIDSKNFNNSYNNVKKIRETESVKMGSVSACLTFSHFNRKEFINHTKEAYKKDSEMKLFTEKEKNILNWCNQYQELQKEEDPDFFFYNYYFSKGIQFLYGIEEELSIRDAKIFFEKARNKKSTDEVNKILAIISVVDLTHPNFKDVVKLVIINEYINK